MKSLLIAFIIIFTVTSCSNDRDNNEATNINKFYLDSHTEKKNGVISQSISYSGTCQGKSYYELHQSNEVVSVGYSNCETFETLKGNINTEKTKITIGNQIYDVKVEGPTLIFLRSFTLMGVNYEVSTRYEKR